MYKNFTDMPVWKESFDLSLDIFKMTADLPRSEDYGLTSQIRRAASSISTNLAEGFGRQTNADKGHFYVIARGSAYETQSHLLYGYKVGYFTKEQTESIYNQYAQLIHSINKLIKSLKSKSQPQSQPQPQPQP